MGEVAKLINNQSSLLEKERLKNIIKILVGLSEKACREGMLSLDEDIPFLPSFLLREGMELILGGTHPDEVTDILNGHINAKEYSDTERLEMTLCREGILLLQSGEHRKGLFDAMILIVGEDFFEGFEYEDFEGFGI